MASNPKPLQRKHRQALLAELVARARSRLPEWRPGGDGQDLAYALFEIAARLGTEVEQRLDQVPEKNRRGFMHWLGLRGQAGRAARAPVVFSMVRGAEAIDAPARVQLQASSAEPPVTLETEHPLRILPARLRALVASSPRQDEFSIAPAPLLALEGPGQGGTRWTITAVSRAGGEAVAQANPPQGLEKGMILQDENGRHHEVIDSNNGLIRLCPAPDDASVNMTLADRFQPFANGKGVIDRQTHALYIGDEALLDLSTEATITIGGTGIGPALLQADWAYWGTEKDNRDGPSDWCPLKPAPSHTQADISITLTKSGNGIIKALGLGGRTSRWLRAQPKPAQNLGPLDGLAISDLTLAVKIQNDKGVSTCEGIANTTPLVLNQSFYPLGREPRQFDAFYLGSNEIFSKKGAEVMLDFTVGGQLATELVAVKATENLHYLFAIGNDGGLKRYQIPHSSQPEPLPTEFPMHEGRRARLSTKSRLSAVCQDGVAYVTAIEQYENTAWVHLFTQSARDQKGGEWSQHHEFSNKPGSPTDCVLIIEDNDIFAYTLISGNIQKKSVTNRATRSEATSGSYARLTKTIEEKGNEKLAAIDTDSKLHIFLENKKEQISDINNKSNYPIIKAVKNQHLVIQKGIANANELFAYLTTQKAPSPIKTRLIDQNSSIAIANTSPDPTVLFMGSKESSACLYAWRPFGESKFDPIPDSPLPNDFAQGPTFVGEKVILALRSGKLIYAHTQENQQWTILAGLQLLVGTNENLTDRSLIATIGKKTVPLIPFEKITLEDNSEIKLLSLNGHDNPTPGDFRSIFSLTEETITERNQEATATWNNKTKWIFKNLPKTISFFYIRISNNEYIIFDSNEEYLAGKTEKIAKNQPYTCFKCSQLKENQYWLPVYCTTLFSTITPTTLVYSIDKIGQNTPIALNKNITTENKTYLFPSTQQSLDAVHIIAHNVLTWSSPFSNEPRNPELSWEYWNGKSWWQLKDIEDITGHLLRGGTLKIRNLPDIEPTDVLGRRNHWIRARLVGGDYGEARTTVTLETDSKDKNKQYQTVHRDADSINAPYVTALKLGYTTSKRSPQAVLTHDNGSWHDQSAAARTAGASLSGFVSLASALTACEADPQGDEGPWQQRGLYLGFDAPLSGQGLSLFCLVDTPADDAPDLRLALDVLGKDGFRPATGLQDGTGGLQQSGTLVFNLSETPVAAELFGQSAWWLRLRTADPARESDWNPILRGAWLNGAWAIAADTLTMEILGSASGAPSQSVRLTHSPVVEGSLELRVREPLGDEEVAALLAEDTDAVRHNVADRPGIWVRWHEVDDIDDATQGQRAYALDDANGEIRFGDGVHGRSPDGGQDAIVAFSYRRGGGALANGIKAWSPTNLSTPLQGVDNCQIVDAAAGGSDAQDGERALAFAPARLHTRERALTLADLENLTRQFSPDIAQARAWSSGQQTRLVVVMARRGSPEPDRGTLRELKKYLVDRSLPGLVRHLGLSRPRQRPLTVLLQLWADDLGLSGQLEAKAYQRIEQLLDPASGGLDQQGWPLGCAPSEADIAAALDDLGDGCGLTSVEIRDADGKHAPAPLARDELVTLAPTGVRCEITQGGTPPATRQEGPCHA